LFSRNVTPSSQLTGSNETQRKFEADLRTQLLPGFLCFDIFEDTHSFSLLLRIVPLLVNLLQVRLPEFKSDSLPPDSAFDASFSWGYSNSHIVVLCIYIFDMHYMNSIHEV
jgi:hypothetical protein